MRAAKILASFLVIGIASSISYFLVTEKPQIERIEGSKDRRIEEPSFEPLSYNLNLPKAGILNLNSTNENSSISTQANLTDFLAKKGAESILKNYDGTRIPNPDAKKLAELSILFDDETAKLENSFNFGPIVDKNELNISESTQSSVTKKYLEGISSITDNFFIDYDFENVISKLKKLETPINLASFHQELISLLITERNLFQAIKNYDQDPIKATLATKQLPDILKKVEITTKFLGELVQKYQ